MFKNKFMDVEAKRDYDSESDSDSISNDDWHVDENGQFVDGPAPTYSEEEEEDKEMRREWETQPRKRVKLTTEWIASRPDVEEFINEKEEIDEVDTQPLTPETNRSPPDPVEKKEKAARQVHHPLDIQDRFVVQQAYSVELTVF